MCSPQSFTPFPYTTLSRSTPCTRTPRTLLPGPLAASSTTPPFVVPEESLHDRNRDRVVGVRLGPDRRRRRRHGPARQDRKSTRLNSSHGYISYAVFCFKTN